MFDFKIPLFTTAKSYPWYTTRSPLSLPLPTLKEDVFFNYRYAIYRAGVFHRWEDPSDGDDDEQLLRHQDNEQADYSNNVHQVPLRLFNAGELYTVNDVLGFTVGPPDIDHIKISNT